MSLGILSIALKPKPAQSAEKVYIIYGPLNLSLSIDSLKTFAETGRVNDELKFYARFADDKAMAQLRKVLQIRSNLSPTFVSQLTYAPISEDFLQRLGRIVQTESGLNGFHAIRAAWILSASRAQSYTLIDILRNYPTHGVRIDFANIQRVKQLLLTLVNYRNAATRAIAQEEQAEAASEPKSDFSQLPNLLKPGAFSVTRCTLKLKRFMTTLKGTPIR